MKTINKNKEAISRTKKIQITIDDIDYAWIEFALKKKGKHYPTSYPNWICTVEELFSYLILTFIAECIAHHTNPCGDQKVDIQF